MLFLALLFLAFLVAIFNNYLGYFISKEGFSVDPEKIKAKSKECG